jgi:hypothetical protein
MATIRQLQSTYAITILTHQRLRHFQRTVNAELFLSTLFRYRDQGKFKGGYSFAVRQQSTGEIWHSGYHEHRIRDLADYLAQLKYIEQNPVRKNYVDYPYTHLNYAGKLDPVPSHLYPRG